MGPTEELAHFVVNYPASEIPDSIIHLGKHCFINFLGVALHASQDPSIEIILKLFEEEGGAARASVIGKNFRTSLQNAAMAQWLSRTFFRLRRHPLFEHDSCLLADFSCLFGCRRAQ
jgi:MmgE/PrpD N-terminal domain